jgi:hypothetical protein
MKHSWLLLSLSWAVFFLFLPQRSGAQERGWRDCARRASVAAGVSDRDIQITPQGETNGDTFILNWEVRSNDPRRQRGYCEIDRRERRIVRFETTPFRHREEFDDSPAYTGEYPRVNVDTDGNGSFSSGGPRSDRLDRGYVDTKGRPAVALRGRNGFRIGFYGEVIGFDGDREMTLRITSSDRGPARGRAVIRLNRDRNEVESISLRGSMAQAGEFQADFNRNR